MKIRKTVKNCARVKETGQLNAIHESWYYKGRY